MLKPGIKDLLWMAAGAAMLAVFVLLVWHFQKDANPAQQMILKTQRIELAARMQLDLTSASEAEKSAVLAITDADSQTFAEQARAATARVDLENRGLSERLAADGTQEERDLLAQFAKGFGEFKRIDDELLALAVKNTNLKASSLASGPAAAALHEMDAALARLASDDPKMLRLIANARIAPWRLQTLLPSHIAEESDQKMDELEAQMAKDDKITRQSLDELAALPTLANNPDLKIAVAAYSRFNETKAQILKLSRENTNVRSLSISLNQKRKAMLVCQATLAALQRALEAEPTGGPDYSHFVSPR